MNKTQTLELIEFINNNYKNYFSDKQINEMLDEWAKELSQYDYEDIKEELKECMSKSEFQMKPPTLYHLTSKCKKKHEKIDYKEIVYYCDLCGKPFNDIDKMMEHRTRESSVNYVIFQTRKWFNKELNKAELYAMEETEFRQRYDKLLHYIYEHTTDEEEKIRIGYIFNPPGQKEAQAFLNKTNEKLQENIIYIN